MTVPTSLALIAPATSLCASIASSTKGDGDAIVGSSSSAQSILAKVDSFNDFATLHAHHTPVSASSSEATVGTRPSECAHNQPTLRCRSAAAAEPLTCSMTHEVAAVAASVGMHLTDFSDVIQLQYAFLALAKRFVARERWHRAQLCERGKHFQQRLDVLVGRVACADGTQAGRGGKGDARERWPRMHTTTPWTRKREPLIAKSRAAQRPNVPRLFRTNASKEESAEQQRRMPDRSTAGVSLSRTSNIHNDNKDNNMCNSSKSTAFHMNRSSNSGNNRYANYASRYGSPPIHANMNYANSGTHGSSAVHACTTSYTRAVRKMTPMLYKSSSLLSASASTSNAQPGRGRCPFSQSRGSGRHGQSNLPVQQRGRGASCASLCANHAQEAPRAEPKHGASSAESSPGNTRTVQPPDRVRETLQDVSNACSIHDASYPSESAMPITYVSEDAETAKESEGNASVEGMLGRAGAASRQHIRRPSVNGLSISALNLSVSSSSGGSENATDSGVRNTVNRHPGDAISCRLHRAHNNTDVNQVLPPPPPAVASIAVPDTSNSSSTVDYTNFSAARNDIKPDDNISRIRILRVTRDDEESNHVQQQQQQQRNVHSNGVSRRARAEACFAGFSVSPARIARTPTQIRRAAVPVRCNTTAPHPSRRSPTLERTHEIEVHPVRVTPSPARHPPRARAGDQARHNVSAAAAAALVPRSAPAAPAADAVAAACHRATVWTASLHVATESMPECGADLFADPAAPTRCADGARRINGAGVPELSLRALVVPSCTTPLTAARRTTFTPITSPTHTHTRVNHTVATPAAAAVRSKALLRAASLNGATATSPRRAPRAITASCNSVTNATEAKQVRRVYVSAVPSISPATAVPFVTQDELHDKPYRHVACQPSSRADPVKQKRSIIDSDSDSGDDASVVLAMRARRDEPSTNRDVSLINSKATSRMSAMHKLQHSIGMSAVGFANSMHNNYTDVGLHAHSELTANDGRAAS